MSRRRMESTSCLLRVLILAACVLGAPALASAQVVSFADQRPFVLGVVPVVGNGAVGGVAIDARGAIEQADERDVAALRDVRQAALDGVAGDVTAPSALRKLSLRRLDALLAEHAAQHKPLPADVLYLAGLQRVEYVLAYPELHDVVLAGPADGWTVDDAGNVVGASSGAAAMQLVDLIAALRTTDALLAGEMISCSIDPTPAGLQRFARLLRGGRAAPSDQGLRRMEQAVGPQSITLTGIAPNSRFAQVLVAADWQMKRLAMGLAASPVEGLPSYLELLNDRPGAAPRNALPRWWIAYGDQPAERDAEGLAWRLSRPGLEVRTAAGRMEADGQIATQRESDPLAAQWADAMTARYDQLAIAAPVFGELRTCMDLALVTAVLASGNLLAHVGLELPMLLDDAHLQLAAHPVPKTVASHASAQRVRRAWVVSVSGGVELDVSHAVNDAAVQADVEHARRRASPTNANSWWWIDPQYPSFFQNSVPSARQTSGSLRSREHIPSGPLPHEGRAGEWGRRHNRLSFCKRSPNLLNHRVPVLVHLVIPKADDAIAAGDQPRGSLRIVVASLALPVPSPRRGRDQRARAP